MRELEDRLAAWRDAGLLTDEQVASIVTFEGDRVAADADDQPGRRSLAAEAVGYVGAALAVGAVALLLGELWQNLAVGGRLALVGLLTALLFGGAAALRTTDQAPVQRLTSVLTTGGVVGTGWLTMLVTGDLLGGRDTDVALAVGLVATAVALPLYLWRRRALPQLTVLAAALVLVGGLLGQPVLEPDPAGIGVTYWVVGAAWLLLGAGGWLVPAPVAGVAGGVVALLATQFASFGDARLPMLLLGVVTAAALVGLAVVRDRLHHLAVGAAGLFVLVPQLVFDLFGDAIGAPATLLVVGLLLVLVAVGLGRARREVQAEASDGARP